MVSTQFHEAQVSENNLDLYVRAFAANSHRGNVKPFNEDRISIITKLSPEYQDIKLFSVFDGHGGHGCADFLRENLASIIARQENLRIEPEKALKTAFKEAEAEFMKRNDIVIKDRSGSCACLVMIMGD